MYDLLSRTIRISLPVGDNGEKPWQLSDLYWHQGASLMTLFQAVNHRSSLSTVSPTIRNLTAVSTPLAVCSLSLYHASNSSWLLTLYCANAQGYRRPNDYMAAPSRGKMSMAQPNLQLHNQWSSCSIWEPCGALCGFTWLTIQAPHLHTAALRRAYPTYISKFPTWIIVVSCTETETWDSPIRRSKIPACETGV